MSIFIKFTQNKSKAIQIKDAGYRASPCQWLTYFNACINNYMVNSQNKREKVKLLGHGRGSYFDNGAKKN